MSEWVGRGLKKRTRRREVRSGVPHLPHKSSGAQGRPKQYKQDAKKTPRHTSDPLAVHINPCLPRKSNGFQKTPTIRHRDTRKTPGRTSDPLTINIIAHLRRKNSGARKTPQRRQRDASDPLAVHMVARLPHKSSGAKKNTKGTLEERQYIHPTPWQCTLSRTCHAKAVKPKEHQRGAKGTSKGCQRDARGTPHARQKVEKRQSNARAYIQPLGSVHCPTPATQKHCSAQSVSE